MMVIVVVYRSSTTENPAAATAVTVSKKECWTVHSFSRHQSSYKHFLVMAVIYLADVLGPEALSASGFMVVTFFSSVLSLPDGLSSRCGSYLQTKDRRS
jgi:hypothetical protein